MQIKFKILTFQMQ